jgi:hypothetical protein
MLQPARDLVVAAPGGEQFDHLTLAWGQLGKGP